MTRGRDAVTEKRLIYGQTKKKKEMIKNAWLKKSYRRQIKKKSLITNDINVE